MQRVEIIEPFAVQEFFVDGSENYEIADGFMTATGYRTQRVAGEKINVAVFRVIMPAKALGPCIEKSREAAMLADGSDFVNKFAS